MTTVRGARTETRGGLNQTGSWQTWWSELLKQVTSCGERRTDERPAAFAWAKGKRKKRVAESDSGPNLLRHPAATVTKL